MPPNDPPMTIGQALEEVADQRELSDREAGEHIGVAQQTFTRWVNGQAIPSSEMIPAIAHFLRLSESKTRALVKASERPRADRRVASRLDQIEEDVAELRRLLTKLLDR
jgi:transcriptional regulator with XRE-family HTH domain